MDRKHTVSLRLLLAFGFLAFSHCIFARTVHLAPQNSVTSVTAALANEPHYSLIFGRASHLCELHCDGKSYSTSM